MFTKVKSLLWFGWILNIVHILIIIYIIYSFWFFITQNICSWRETPGHNPPPPWVCSDNHKSRNITPKRSFCFTITLNFSKRELWRGSVYWQTVTVCQLEIIGRPSKKYERAPTRCRNLLNSAVIVALLYRAIGVCQQEEIGRPFTYFVNGLPIISYWQTITVCQ